MNSFFENKVVLITGGSGSFGQACARWLLSEDLCQKVIIFSRDEWKQWEMRKKDPIFRHEKIRYFLGDIRDLSRLQRAFHEVECVIHAAALKQVPAAEYNPTEFVQTNIQGAMNIINAAIDCGVKKVIALSTDKAVNPVNLYGATKLCSDKLFIAGNSYVGKRGYPIFSVVRYGNVASSRGSIIPHWQNLIGKGTQELPITDPRMTRFMITLEKAVAFVLQAIPNALGGEIFVPKIPSIHITDLAQAMAPDLPQKIIGIRPGEKLHELMISVEDARHTLEFEDQYIIVPEFSIHEKSSPEKYTQNRSFQHPPEGFAYTSDTNTQWLTIPELKKLANSTLKGQS